MRTFPKGVVHEPFMYNNRSGKPIMLPGFRMRRRRANEMLLRLGLTR